MLTLLGMGLPRHPLTGQNSGQPDIGHALRLAADIVIAARTRALLRGQRVDQPLGALAGEFLGYELSVRGRQYQSIAKVLNTGLLGDPTVATVMKDGLGFTLLDIRAVREASTALLNERFFGARDRLGNAARSGAAFDNIDRDAHRRDLNLMVNECRLFGTVSAADAADRAGMDESIAKAVLEFFSTSRPAEDEPNPVDRFAQGERLAPWGCVADDGEYLMLNGFLGEDELRRDIERGLVAAATGKGGSAGKAWGKYLQRRALYWEAMSAAALGRLLAGVTPRWEGQKYLGPVSFNDTSRLGSNANPTDVQT